MKVMKNLSHETKFFFSFFFLNIRVGVAFSQFFDKQLKTEEIYQEVYCQRVTETH